MKLSEYMKSASADFEDFVTDNNLITRKNIWIHLRLFNWIRDLFYWKLGITAITFGRHIFYFDLMIMEGIIVHELVHVKQYKKYTFLGFLIKYVYEYFKSGYDSISFEKEAYAVQVDFDVFYCSVNQE